mgnify:CR=1 FL=1
MSKRFHSADIHANHANICIYCNRPWLREADLTIDREWTSQLAASECAIRMNLGLTHNFNMRIKPEDRVVHYGDFATAGKVRGVNGTGESYLDFLNRLNGRWTLLRGNHDKQGRVKTIGDYLFGNIGPYRFFGSHYPTDDENQDPELIRYVRTTCQLAIVGHVHAAWKTKWHDGILNVNVGVDVNNYIPLSDDEVLEIYEKETR